MVCNLLTGDEIYNAKSLLKSISFELHLSDYLLYHIYNIVTDALKNTIDYH